MKAEIENKIETMLQEQRLAVLATLQDGTPYSSLVAFTADAGSHTILFTTLADSNKARNIRQNPRVSLLIDNRKNLPSDFQDAAALAVRGSAVTLGADAEETVLDAFIHKHPSLEPFIRSKRSVFIRVHVDTYQYVDAFQNVRTLEVGSERT